MDQEQKTREGDDGNDFALDLKIPDTSKIQTDAKELIRQQHFEMNAEADKDKDKDKKGKGKEKQRQRRGGSICFCGSEGCGIGHMVERQE